MNDKESVAGHLNKFILSYHDYSPQAVVMISKYGQHNVIIEHNRSHIAMITVKLSPIAVQKEYDLEKFCKIS